VLFDVIPLEEVRHFFSHLHMPPESKPKEREALVEAARKHLSKLEYTSDALAYTAIRLLERVPVKEEAERLVEAVAADKDASSTLIRDAVNVLADEKLFAKYFDELSRYELAPEEIPYVFGKGGFEVVEPLMNRVASAPSSFQMVAIKDALRIHSPRAVKGFVALYDDSSVAPMAHGWLTGEGANAISGLIPLATGRTSLTHVAQRVLREYRDRGHMETITRLAANESCRATARLGVARGRDRHPRGAPRVSMARLDGRAPREEAAFQETPRLHRRGTTPRARHRGQQTHPPTTRGQWCDQPHRGLAPRLDRRAHPDAA